MSPEQRAEYRERNRERLREEAREYYRQNRERILAAKRERYAADEEHRERIKQVERERARHEEVRARRLVYRRANRAEHVAAAVRRDRGIAADPEHYEILQADVCAYCGKPAGDVGEVDHIVPVEQGGDGEWENLTAACRSCNAQKSNKPMLHFLLDRVPDVD